MKFTIKSAIDNSDFDTWDIDTILTFDEDFVREQAVASIACSVYSKHYGEPAEDSNEALDAVGDVEVKINHISEAGEEAGGTAFCGGFNLTWEIA